jgi:hypothetical protein
MGSIHDNQPELCNYIQSLPIGPRPACDRGARRDRVLPSLPAYAEREVQRVRRRRTLLRAASVTVVGGATIAAAVWVGLPSSRRTAPAQAHSDSISPAQALTVIDGAVLLEWGGVRRTLHAGDSIGLAEIGAIEASADMPARVRLSDVVALTLAPFSRLRPIKTGGGRSGGTPPALEVIALERGRVHLEVKKLGDAHRFHVVTPDADVEVRGTAFDVVLRPGGVPQTCVSVDEGLVLVASGLESRLLSRGARWGCDDVRTGTTAVQTEQAPQVLAKRLGHASRSVASHLDVSDLGVQNRLFQIALTAERAGRFDDAIRTYRGLLARVPHGPLAAQARANLAAVTASP